MLGRLLSACFFEPGREQPPGFAEALEARSLLEERQLDTLADVLKSLKQGVSRRLIGDAEHFWQNRYYDFNIRDYGQFVEKLR